MSDRRPFSLAGLILLLPLLLILPPSATGRQSIPRELTGSGSFASLMITEIMFRPQTGDPEWIEVLNESPTPQQLRSYSLRDARGPFRPLDGGGEILLPGGYVIIAEDPIVFRQRFDPPPSTRLIGVIGSWPRLNNGAFGSAEPADILVLGRGGSPVDSVVYWAEWAAEKGQSIERVDFSRPSTDPQAWMPSDPGRGPSPGLPAPGTTRRRQGPGLRIEPNPFRSRSGEGSICLEIPPGGPARGRALIYDLRGHLIAHLWEGEMPTRRMCVGWRGTDDAGRELPAGVYVVLFAGLDAETGKLWRERGRLILD